MWEIWEFLNQCVFFCSFKRSLLESLGWKENPSKKLKFEQLKMVQFWGTRNVCQCYHWCRVLFLHLWFDSPRDIKHKATPHRFVPKFRFGRLKIIYIYIYHSSKSSNGTPALHLRQVGTKQWCSMCIQTLVAFFWKFAWCFDDFYFAL